MPPYTTCTCTSRLSRYLYCIICTAKVERGLYWAAALSATAEGTYVADTYLWKNLWEPYHTSTYISVLQIDDRDYLYLKIICAGGANRTDTSRLSVPKLRALQRYLVYLCQNALVAYIHLDNLCICTYPVHIHLD